MGFALILNHLSLGLTKWNLAFVCIKILALDIVGYIGTWLCNI